MGYRCCGMTQMAGAVLLLSVLLTPTPVKAQAQEPDPMAEARVRLGSFAFTPAVFVTGGYDSNITRTSDGEGDWELVTSPQIDAWLALGRALLNINSAVELTNHQKDPPVTFNYFNGVSLTVPGGVLKPTVSYSNINLYARPTGFEIGERSRRVENSAGARLDWQVGSRTTLSADVSWLKLDWDGAAEYQGSNLQEFLNRTITTGLLSAGSQLTPLTSVFAAARVTRDRFEFSPERDGESLDLLGGVTLASPALISGTGVIGFRHAQARTSGAQDYNGLVYIGQFRYVRESRTRLLVDLDRQPTYSYTESLGYYLLTSTSAAYIQSISQDWETSVFGGYHFLDYRLAGLPAGEGTTTRRTDLGGGVSRRVGAFTRVGVNYSYIMSRGADRYDAWRAVMYIVYGSDKLKRLDRPLPDER